MGREAIALVEQLASDADIVSVVRAGSLLLSAIADTPYGNPRDMQPLVNELENGFHAGDDLYRSYALRALIALGAPTAEARLLDSLTGNDPVARQAAAWSATGHVSTAVVPALVSTMLDGGQFERMLAQLASISAPVLSPAARLATILLLRCADDPSHSIDARRAAIECLPCLSSGSRTVISLRRLAFDAGTHTEIRAAAIRALGDCGDQASADSLLRLVHAADSARLSTAAIEVLGLVRSDEARGPLLAIIHQYSGSSDPESAQVYETAVQAIRTIDQLHQMAPARRGLHIAQLSMRGAIDSDLKNVGEEDGGGLATLVVNLGRALGKHPKVDRAYTVTRAYRTGDTLAVHDRRAEPLGDPSSQLIRIPFGPVGFMSAASMWGSVLQIERGLRIFFSSVPPLDGIHLRFADAGTWAAARWARRAGVPIHFTLAPDPYLPIRSAQAAGTLSRESFGSAEVREHYLYRSHILDWMVEHAAGLALLPRPHWERDAPLFFGITSKTLGTSTSRPSRIRVIAEGIDVVPTHEVPMHAHESSWTDNLGAHFSQNLERRGKPVILTVGRLHEVKGMARLVEAWAGDGFLRDAFNLVVVGGNLDLPSGHERRILGEIADSMKRHPEAAGGLVLLGSQPHHEVVKLMSAVRSGIPELAAPHGLYVCASEKEEFGLAILEAMASELVVVAPAEGGPATYIVPDQTGYLVDTRNISALRNAIVVAAHTRNHDEARTDMTWRARHVVLERYSSDRMADELVHLYASFAPSEMETAVAS
jgi:glycosyltransferase involved in cell wall biosynthesis/HEAT repeat protein